MVKRDKFITDICDRCVYYKENGRCKHPSYLDEDPEGIEVSDDDYCSLYKLRLNN